LEDFSSKEEKFEQWRYNLSNANECHFMKNSEGAIIWNSKK